MHIGIDFDNTIACYDKVFHEVAVENGLIPSDMPPGKNNVRDYLRKIGKEDEWTRLQGLVYGTKMNYVEAFPGVFDFMNWCQKKQVAISIISHKTRHPYMGPKYDLHLAALQWMETQGFFEPRKLGLLRTQVFLELTKADKIKRIKDTGCTHFIDDLPEFLLEPDFPQNVISILFDPNNMVAAVTFPFRRCSSWDEILIDFKTTRNMIRNREQHSSSIYRHAMLLAQKAGLEGDILLDPMASGGNNRVFRLTVGNDIFLLKSYLYNSKDLRDRLGHEFAFSSFAWNYGVKAVPRPVACDHVHLLGLYEFIDGKKICSGEATWEHIRQALDFFVDLNSHKEKPNASKLPIASEACFNIAEHLLCVDRRLKQLLEIKPCDGMDREASDFIHNGLSVGWKNVRDRVVSLSRDLRIEMDESLPSKERCLSPSDFGFHNAIREKNGKLRFIDFEYAGWDDPAKMICDFFCQPEVPMPLKHFSRFLHEINVALNVPKYFRNRVNLLFPVYQIKWCCIMLNDFLPVDSERKKYASDNKDRRELQLNKAKRYLNKLY